MIEIQQISKSYNSVQVLNNVSVSFESGKITALSGPNGSGKTTMVKAILGMIMLDTGDIKIDDKSIKNQIEYKGKIGYISQNINFPENSKVYELINTICSLRNHTPNLEYYYKTYQLTPHLKKKFKQLSGGTKQKINTILGIMFDFDIIIADEPSVGLDPHTRITFKNTLIDLKNSGKTIIIVTHLLNEIEDIADDIVYLIDGNIIINENVKSLKANGKNLDEIIAEKVNNYEHSI